jgi:hypothetical protein
MKITYDMLSPAERRQLTLTDLRLIRRAMMILLEAKAGHRWHTHGISYMLPPELALTIHNRLQAQKIMQSQPTPTTPPEALPPVSAAQPPPPPCHISKILRHVRDHTLDHNQPAPLALLKRNIRLFANEITQAVADALARGYLEPDDDEDGYWLTEAGADQLHKEQIHIDPQHLATVSE